MCHNGFPNSGGLFLKGDREMSETVPRVWLVRAGGHGEDEATVLDQGLAIIGFRDVPDLSQLTSPEQIARCVRESFPSDGENRVRNLAAQLRAFVLRMNVGDTVVLPLKIQRGLIAVGCVRGSYKYREVNGEQRHTREVEWARQDVPREDLHQDLLHSLGAFLTVCRIERNDADRRVAAIVAGRPDPGPSGTTPPRQDNLDDLPGDEGPSDLGELAQDQIRAYIKSRFAGHDLAHLVDAVLQADGFSTQLSPPGADGGVDIFAGRGALGLEPPRLCIQVKSSQSPVDVGVLRSLQGSMQTFSADLGLLVCWGGFTRPTLSEARQNFFNVRLWNASDLIEAIYRTYELFPDDLQARLPLKRVWALVPEDVGS